MKFFHRVRARKVRVVVMSSNINRTMYLCKHDVAIVGLYNVNGDEVGNVLIRAIGPQDISIRVPHKLITLEEIEARRG